MKVPLVISNFNLWGGSLAILLSLVISLFQEITYSVACDPLRVFWQQDWAKADLHRSANIYEARWS